MSMDTNMSMDTTLHATPLHGNNQKGVHAMWRQREQHSSSMDFIIYNMNNISSYFQQNNRH